MTHKKTILFVCTGNCVRSQIAEGFGRTYADGRFEIMSAGAFPHGLHPVVVETMKEIGIDVSAQTSDIITSAMIEQADLIVTLCTAVRDKLPLSARMKKQIHWDIENPDIAYSSDTARRAAFARVRDLIGEKVKKLLNEF